MKANYSVAPAGDTRLLININKELKNMLKVRAYEEGQTMREFVECAIRTYLNARPPHEDI